ncbi:MAG TPA: DUF3887 domain-containing protein [Allocoleopsis sp.]
MYRQISIALLSTLSLLATSCPVLAGPIASTESPQLVAQLPSLSNAEARQLEQSAEQFVTDLSKADYEAAQQSLRSDLRDSVTSDLIQEQWQQALDAKGSFEAIIDSRAVATVNGYVVLVTTRFANGNEDLLILFDQEKEMIGADLASVQLDIQATAEQFVDALAAGDYGRARVNFHPQLKAELSPQDLQQRWESLQTITGAFQRRLESEVIPGGDMDVVTVNVEFADRTDSLVIIFQDNRIAGVDFPREAATP